MFDQMFTSSGVQEEVRTGEELSRKSSKISFPSAKKKSHILCVLWHSSNLMKYCSHRTYAGKTPPKKKHASI